jgi:hypothetical protein
MTATAVPVTTRPKPAGLGQARRVAVVAALAGVGFLALGVESVLGRDGIVDGRDLAFIAPWVLLGLTVWGVHVVQRPADGRLGARAAGVVLAAVLVTSVGTVGLGLDVPALEAVVPLGALLFVGGMVAMGIATTKAGVLPRWAGWLIALTQPLTMATGVALSPWAALEPHGSYSGAVTHGVVCLALAGALVRVGRR